MSVLKRLIVPSPSRKNKNHKKFIKSSIGSFLLRVLNILINLTLSIFLSRTLGAKGFGEYSYIVALLTLLVIPGTLGFDKLLVREVSIYKVNQKHQHIKGLLTWSSRVSTILCFILCTVTGIFFWMFPESRMNGINNWIFICALFIILPLISQTSLKEAALRGFDNIVVGKLSGFIVAPSILLGGSFFYDRFFPGGLNLATVISIYGIAYFFSTIISTILLNCRYCLRNSSEPIYNRSIWLKSSVPLMLLTVMQTLNVRVDLLMLGAMQGASSVGVYVVVSRLVQQMYIASAVIAGVLLPSIAGLYEQGKISYLQKLITKAARISFVLSFTIGSLLFLFADQVLLIFGSDFISGSSTLNILVLGQIFNISLGAVGSILTMTGHERYMIFSVSISTVLNILLNYLLIPRINIDGAAIATTTSLIVWNLSSYYFVKKKTGIESSFVGARSM